MRLLLDTHILLWRLAGSDRLPVDAITLIDDQSSAVYASAASVWEVTIKWSLRKGPPDDMPLSGRAFAAALGETGIEILPVTPGHAAGIDDLPAIDCDPFDRLLIATARSEQLRLMTRDSQLAAYGESVLVI